MSEILDDMSYNIMQTKRWCLYAEKRIIVPLDGKYSFDFGQSGQANQSNQSDQSNQIQLSEELLLLNLIKNILI